MATEKQKTAFEIAVSTEHHDVVALFIDSKKVDLTIPFQKNQHILLYAALYGWTDIVTKILAMPQGKALINVPDPDKGWTALHYASALGHVTIVQVLLENGANTVAKTKAGNTALVLAASRTKKNRKPTHTDIVRLLLDHMQSDGINLAGEDKHTALEFAGMHEFKAAVALFIDSKKIDYTLVFTKNQHILIYAAIYGWTDIVHKILAVPQGKALVDIADPADGLTALHTAASRGHTDIVSLLLQHMKVASVNLTSTAGYTAFEVAVAGKQPEVVEKLIGFEGINLSLKTAASTIEEIATKHGWTGVTHALNAPRTCVSPQTAKMTALEQKVAVMEAQLQQLQAQVSRLTASGTSSLVRPSLPNGLYKSASMSNLKSRSL